MWNYIQQYPDSAAVSHQGCKISIYLYGLHITGHGGWTRAGLEVGLGVIFPGWSVWGGEVINRVHLTREKQDGGVGEGYRDRPEKISEKRRPRRRRWTWADGKNGEEESGDKVDVKRKMRGGRQRKTDVKQNKPENKMQFPCWEKRVGAMYRWKTEQTGSVVMFTGLWKLQRKDHNLTVTQVLS